MGAAVRPGRRATREGESEQMSVYVDELLKHGGSASFHWVHSCHLYADSLHELHEFAEGLGLKRQWFQDKEGFPHYDLTVGKRAMAVKRGAMEKDRFHAVNFSRALRGLPAIKNPAQPALSLFGGMG
jgi:uncharacterized protein DUF4031